MAERDIIPTINSGNLCLNIEDGAVTFNGKLVFLSSNETDLFAVLILSEKVISNEEIVKRTVGDNLPYEVQIRNERAIGFLIQSLKKKLEKVGVENSIINRHGHGYKWTGV